MSALNTYSKFYYGWRITQSNKFIDFNDGTIKVAELKVGSYTSAQLALEIKKKLDALSTIDFSVSFNRITRKFTITGTTNFSLLFGTGVHSAQSASSVLGYNQTDLTGANVYLAPNVSGYEYKTQFILQSYKSPETNRKAIDASVNKSSNGDLEVIKFGNERFMECDFKFITDIAQHPDSIVRTNYNGVNDFIQLIEWCTEKYPVEFMKDENNTDDFQSFILESTASDSKGLDYDLIETYDRGLPFYYETGKLKFKLI